MAAPDWLPAVVVLTWKSVRWKTTAVALLVLVLGLVLGLVLPPLGAGVPAATVVPADAPAGALVAVAAFEVVVTGAAASSASTSHQRRGREGHRSSLQRCHEGARLGARCHVLLLDVGAHRRQRGSAGLSDGAAQAVQWPHRARPAVRVFTR